jgi:hypothetical protein
MRSQLSLFGDVAYLFVIIDAGNAVLGIGVLLRRRIHQDLLAE